jgi:hypothetical protein
MCGGRVVTHEPDMVDLSEADLGQQSDLTACAQQVCVLNARKVLRAGEVLAHVAGYRDVVEVREVVADDAAPHFVDCLVPQVVERRVEQPHSTGTCSLSELLAELHPALTADGLLVFAGHDTARTDNPVRQSTLQLLVFGDDPDEVTARRGALEARISH